METARSLIFHLVDIMNVFLHKHITASCKIRILLAYHRKMIGLSLIHICTLVGICRMIAEKVGKEENFEDEEHNE